MRHTEQRVELMIRRTLQQPMPVGLEGVRFHMRGIHQLSRLETDEAVKAYRAGLSVAHLRQHPLFAPKLQAEEKAARLLPVSLHQQPVDSYSLLFGAGESIDHLVAFGHHELINRWCKVFDMIYEDLSLPLEEFYNTALYTILPHEARTYEPDPGHPGFEVWASRMLFWRLHSLAKKREREVKTLVADGRQHFARKDGTRRAIISLDSSLDTARREIEAYAEVETLKEALPGNLPGPEKLEDQSARTALFQLAGLTANEQKALVALVMYDYEHAEVGELLRRNERTVRYYRDHALAKLRSLGDEKTILAVLKGDIDEV